MTDEILDVVKEVGEKTFKLKESREQIRQAVELVRREAERLVIKSKLAWESKAGVASYGSTSVLVAQDGFGRDLLAFQIPLSEFFAELERRKLIELEKKFEVAEPSEELKRKILDGYVSYLDAVKKLLGVEVSQKDLRGYVKALKEGKLLEFLVSFSRKNRLAEKLRFSYVSEDFSRVLEKKLREYRKSESAAIKQSAVDAVAKALVERYRESAHSLVNNKEKTAEALSSALIKAHGKESEQVRKEAKELASVMIEACLAHYSHVTLVQSGALKLAGEMLESERLKLTDDVQKRWKLFEQLFTKLLSLKKHQFTEAVRYLAKREKTAEAGHLLGWEMRSGKTLAMLSVAFFHSLSSGQDSYIFPKTANVNDVLRQAVGFMPSYFFAFRGYTSGDAPVNLPERRLRKMLSADVFPNIFKILSQMKEKKAYKNAIFRDRGKSAERLLAGYAKRMEELISFFEKNSAEKYLKLAQKEAQGKPYAFVLELEGFKPSVRLALFFYLERLRRSGELLTKGRSEKEEAALKRQFAGLEKALKKQALRLSEDSLKRGQLPPTEVGSL